MRYITAPSLTFLVTAFAAGCVPSAPAIQDLKPPGGIAGDASTGGRDAAAPDEPAARADAALPTRFEAASERPRDLGGELAGDSRGSDALLRLDVAAEIPRDAAAADTASRDAADHEVRAGRAPRAGELAIAELLVDPAGNDLGHEWMEIANLTTEALDLTALHLADDATEIPVDGGVLAPRAFLVLGQSADREHNGDAPVEVAYGTRLAFNNGADRITLCDGPCAQGVVLATFDWTESFGPDYAGRAVVVGAKGSICPATATYGAGADLGSPGRANPPCGPDAGTPADARDH